MITFVAGAALGGLVGYAVAAALDWWERRRAVRRIIERSGRRADFDSEWFV